MDEPKYNSDTQRALKLFTVLARCLDSIGEHARDDIQRHGLKVSEFAILELLYHKGPTAMGEIAERILLTSGSITHVVDQLEKKGLAQRVSCPSDRRVLYADLTEAGREKIAAIFPDHAERIRRACEGLTPEEQEQAVVLLKKLGLAAKSFQP